MTRINGITRRSLLRHGVCGAATAIAGASDARMALAQPISDEIGPDERSEMAIAAHEYMKEHGVPGLVVAIARDGRLVYSAGFGDADQKKGEKVTPTHLFRIASVSKPITSVAIFSLLQQGRLRLEDTVFGARCILQTDYGKPPFKLFVEAITVEHLLTHTWGWQNDGRDPMFSNPHMTHHQLLSWALDNIALANPPGTKYAYSNFGYCVLGRVIEKVARQPYADYVRGSVLARAGITEMRIAGNVLAERAPGEIVYYGQDGGNPYGMNVARMDSHGGWLASAVDLVRFVMHVDRTPTTPGILNAETLRTMMTPSALNRGYAKGWAVNAKNQWHNGGLPGTSAIMVRTHSGFCWAALANSRRAKPNSVEGIDAMVWKMARAVKGWAA